MQILLVHFLQFYNALPKKNKVLEIHKFHYKYCNFQRLQANHVKALQNIVKDFASLLETSYTNDSNWELLRTR